MAETRLSRIGWTIIVASVIILLQLISTVTGVYLTFTAKEQSKTNEKLLKAQNKRDIEQSEQLAGRSALIDDAIRRIVNQIATDHQTQTADIEELIRLITTPPPAKGVSGAPGLRGAQGPPGPVGPPGPIGNDGAAGKPAPSLSTTTTVTTTTSTTRPPLISIRVG